MVTETSLEAYRAIKPKLQALHHDIINTLRAESGAVSDLAARLGVFPKTVANRLSELRADGMIEPTGTRRNARGRSETIWKAK